MASPNTDNYARGVFLQQKKSKTGEVLDADLESGEQFDSGESDDPDRIVDSEALGARHRRRFGYSAEGAEENDQDIAAKGRKPQTIVMHKSKVPESRIANFSHGVTAHKELTTVQMQRRPSTI